MSLFSSPWRRRRRQLDAVSLDAFLAEGFVAIDLETTGLDPRRDAIIEMAAIAFVDGMPRSRYVTHVNPGRPIPQRSGHIHGLTDAVVASAPLLPEAMSRFDAICADRPVVGHRVGFDLEVLRRARRRHGLRRITNPVIDTRRLAAALYPRWAQLSFEEIAARMGIGILGRHTAEGDALGAGELLLVLLPEIRVRKINTLAELLWLQGTAESSGF